MASPSNSGYKGKNASGRGGRPAPDANGDPTAPRGTQLELREPPRNIDAEQGVLASCILDTTGEVLNICLAAKLRPEYFTTPANQIIYQALIDLYSLGRPVDEIILADRLQSENKLEEIGGQAYLVELTNRIDTPAHARHWLEIVREKYFYRQIIRTSTWAIEEAYKPQENLDHYLEKIESTFFAISQDRISDSAQALSESVDDAMAMVQRMLQNRGQVSGVPSGFKDLDQMTFGFHPAEMIVIAARPSMGKTSIALNMAEAAILPKSGTPSATLLFSLEMSADQLAMRLLCAHARVDMQKMKAGFIAAEAQQELARSAKLLKNAPLWIDASANLNILELRAKARRVHSQHTLGLIIVDYLQLVSGTDNRVQREQQIAEISRGMKAMAKELKVPVIVLSQLNRESEKEKRQPRLSDLRESGSIEQDADVVLLLSRPKESATEDEDRSLTSVKRELIVAKNRNGPVGEVPLMFVRNITRYENFSPHSAQ